MSEQIADKATKKEAGDTVPKANPKTDGQALLKDIGIIVLFYLVFTTFGWGAFHIPSSSMEPTLEVGDRIFVSKLAYGYNRYSFPFDPSFMFEDKILSDTPERGDVVVFTLPYKGNVDFIKRVIGLPGDTIQMLDGRLYINGTIVARQHMRDVNYTSYQGQDIHAKEFEETLPNGVKHKIYERSDRGQLDNTGLFKVPERNYFMMGDNRDGSADSREVGPGVMGFVKHKYLVGRADITTFSLYDCDQGKDIGCFIGIPYGRFFKSLH